MIKPPIHTDPVYDLIVVGCGAAGLSAALAHQLEAQRQGRATRVAILEVASKELRGGATRWTTAAFRIRPDDRLDPLWIGTVAEVSKGLADLDYCRRFEQEVPAAIKMLKESNVDIHYYPGGIANVSGVGGAAPNGGGHAIVNALAGRLETLAGMDLLYETEAMRLVLEEGQTCGVVIRASDGHIRTLRSKAVVLACGGFEGNPRMLTQFVGPRACDLKLIAPGIAYNKGAGIRMGIEAGADTAGQFDGIHSELVDVRSDKADAVVLNHPFGIVVNGEAKRFFDEGLATFDATFELIAYEVWRNQNSKAFIILDQQTLKHPILGTLVYSHVPPVQGDTIAELAEQLGLDPRALEATVAGYNAATRPGSLDPSKLDGWGTNGLVPPKSNWAAPLFDPPYAAYPVTTAITFTYGGLKTDTDARVIGTNGHPIPGLYAAGEIVGLFYHEYPAGTSVLKALAFGRIAGIHAAARLEAGVKA